MRDLFHIRGGVRITPHLTLLVTSSLHRLHELLLMDTDVQSLSIYRLKWQLLLQQRGKPSMLMFTQYSHSTPTCEQCQAISCQVVHGTELQTIRRSFLKEMPFPKPVYPKAVLGSHVPPPSHSRHFHQSRYRTVTLL